MTFKMLVHSNHLYKLLIINFHVACGLGLCTKIEEYNDVTLTINVQVVNMTHLNAPLCATPRYILTKHQLGRGGYSNVTIAQPFRHTGHTGHELACKIVPKNKNKNIRQEIDIMHHLKGQPHIVQVEDVLEDDDNVYILMDKCGGGHLGDFGAHTDSVKVIKGCLEALAICHENNVIHADIKPHNFMLKREGDLSTITLIDFGLAYKEDQLKDFTLQSTTPWFTAPELLVSKLCKKSDVWSIGIMAYVMLSRGCYPFNDRENPSNPSIYRIFNSILNDVLYVGGMVDASDVAKDFVCRCLEKDVDRRMTVREALDHEWIRAGIR